MNVAQPTKLEDPAVFDEELNQRDNAKVQTNTQDSIPNRNEDSEMNYRSIQTKQKETNHQKGSNHELFVKQNATLAKVDTGKKSKTNFKTSCDECCAY